MFAPSGDPWGEPRLRRAPLEMEWATSGERVSKGGPRVPFHRIPLNSGGSIFALVGLFESTKKAPERAETEGGAHLGGNLRFYV